MTAADVIKFNNLLVEAGHLFASKQYDRAEDLLADAGTLINENRAAEVRL